MAEPMHKTFNSFPTMHKTFNDLTSLSTYCLQIMPSSHSSSLLLLFGAYCYLQLQKPALGNTCRNYVQILTALYRWWKLFFSFFTFCFLKCTEWIHIISIFLMKRERKFKTHTGTTNFLSCQLFLISPSEALSWHLLSLEDTAHPSPAVIPPLLSGFCCLSSWASCRAQYTCSYHSDSQTGWEVWLWRGQAGTAMSQAWSSSAAMSSQR